MVDWFWKLNVCQQENGRETKLFVFKILLFNFVWKHLDRKLRLHYKGFQTKKRRKVGQRTKGSNPSYISTSTWSKNPNMTRDFFPNWFLPRSRSTFLVLSNSVFPKISGVYNTTEKRRRVIKKGTLYHKTLQLPLVSCTTGIFSKLAEDYSGQDTIYFLPFFSFCFSSISGTFEKGKKISLRSSWDKTR